MSTSFEEHRRVELAIAQSDTNFIYVAAANSSGELAGFYRSTNAGISWQKLGSSPNWLGNQGWYDNTLIVHPFNENIIFVGGIDLYQITAYDHSMSAIQISSWWGGNGLPYVHADHHCLVTIPHADSTFALISTNDGGVFIHLTAAFTGKRVTINTMLPSIMTLINILIYRNMWAERRTMALIFLPLIQTIQPAGGGRLAVMASIAPGTALILPLFMERFMIRGFTNR